MALISWAYFCLVFKASVWGLVIGLAIGGAESISGEVIVDLSEWLQWKVLIPKKAPRCFFFQDSFSTKPNNTGLVNDLPICWHRPHYCKLPWLYTSYYCSCLALWLFLPVSFLWYFTPAIICKKCHESSISLEALFYKLACSPDAIPKKVQRIYPWVSSFAWFWYICYSTKLSYLRHSF